MADHRRLVIGLALILIMISACSPGTDAGDATTVPAPTTTTSTTTTSTTTTTTIPPTTTLSEDQLAAAQLEADKRAILTLYRRWNDTWFQGSEAGVEYKVAHNWLDTTFEECWESNFPDGPYEGYSEEWIVDAPTIDTDDGWALPDGPQQGEVPSGRIYIYTVSITYRATGYDSDTEPGEVHAVVDDDGVAKFFFECRA